MATSRDLCTDAAMWMRSGLGCRAAPVTDRRTRSRHHIPYRERTLRSVTHAPLPQQHVVRLRRGVAEELGAAVPLVGLADGAGGEGQDGEAAQEAAVGLVRPRHRT